MRSCRSRWRRPSRPRPRTAPVPRLLPPVWTVRSWRWPGGRRPGGVGHNASRGHGAQRRAFWPQFEQGRMPGTPSGGTTAGPARGQPPGGLRATSAGGGRGAGPTVSSSGADLATLESYFLSQPGISRSAGGADPSHWRPQLDPARPGAGRRRQLHGRPQRSRRCGVGRG